MIPVEVERLEMERLRKENTRLRAQRDALVEALKEAIRIDEDEPCGSDSGYQDILTRWRKQARAALVAGEEEQ